MHVCALAHRPDIPGGAAWMVLLGHVLPLQVESSSCSSLMQSIIVSFIYKRKQALLSWLHKHEVKSLGINPRMITWQSSGANILLHHSD